MATTKDVLALVRQIVPDLSTDPELVLSGKATHYLWTGEIPRANGYFWIPGIWSGHSIALALQREMARGHSRDEALTRIKKWHAGLQKDEVTCVWSAFVEIDHLPRAEQEAAYAEFEAATGLRFGLQAFSGGKSVHSYLLFLRALTASEAVRAEIQQLLAVALCGDPQIVDAGRLMRLPGYSGLDRPQPVVRFEPEHRYDPEHVVQVLRQYVADLGIGDVEVALECLREAHDLEIAARKAGDLSEAAELQELADLLRATRGAPAEVDRRAARAALGRRDVSAPSSVSSGASVSRAGPGVWNDMPVPNPYAGIAPWTSVDAPCCVKQGGRKGTVMDHGKVWCQRHQWGFRPALERAPAEVDLSGVEMFGGEVQVQVVEHPEPELAAVRAEIAAEHERDLNESYEREAEMADLRDWSRVKREAAEALPQELVDAATSALKVARGVLPQLVERLQGHRVVEPCGRKILTSNAATGEFGTYSPGCRRFRCPECGPMRAAAKIGGVLHMPIIEATDGGDVRVVGRPIGERPVWVYHLDQTELSAFTDAWQSFTRRFSNKDVDPIRESPGETSGRQMTCGICKTKGHNRRACPEAVVEVRVRRIPGDTFTRLVPEKVTRREAESVASAHGAHAYVAFRPGGGGTTTVISTCEVPNQAKRLVAALTSATEIQNLVFGVGVVAYQLDIDEDVGVRVILGKISSSRGLLLDPARVAQIASGSTWVAVARDVNPGELVRAAHAHGVNGPRIRTTVDPETAEVVSVRSAGHVSPDVVVAIVKDAGGELLPRPSNPPRLIRRPQPRVKREEDVYFDLMDDEDGFDDSFFGVSKSGRMS